MGKSTFEELRWLIPSEFPLIWGILIYPLIGTKIRYQKRVQAKAAQQRKEKQQGLEQERARMQREYEQKCDQVFETVVNTNPEAIEKAMQQTLTEYPFLQEFYDGSKTALYNYNQHPMLQSAVKRKLRELFPEAFKSLDDQYKTTLDELNAQTKQGKPRQQMRR